MNYSFRHINKTFLFEMLRLIPIFLFIAVCSPALTKAARMPDKVEREFVIEGEDAIAITDFLGFSSTHDGVYRLPWPRSTAKCFKEMGENGPIYALCDLTVRINVISFYSGERPKLVISGYWFDGETGTAPDVPKYYFSSPIVGAEEEILDWKLLIEKFGALPSSGKRKDFQTSENNTPFIRISLDYIEGKPRFGFSLDDRLPDIRKMAERKYQDCLEWHRHHPIMDGGC